MRQIDKNCIRKICVVIAFLIGLLFFKMAKCYFSFLFNNDLEELNNGSLWTLILTFSTSPIAFVIWSFRDQNKCDEINNQRNDTNLKEFNQLAEWIAIQNPSPNQLALKISAIYNLLPFYRGKKGSNFVRSAFILLKTSWLSLHQKEFKRLEQKIQKIRTELFSSTALTNSDVLYIKLRGILTQIQNNANTPLGSAICQVILAEKGEYLLAYPEFINNMTFTGMDFEKYQVKKDLFKGKQLSNLSIQGINLTEFDFSGCQFSNVDFTLSFLNKANFNQAIITGEKFYFTQFKEPNFSQASLATTTFYDCKLENAKTDNIKIQFGVAFKQCEVEQDKFDGAKFYN
ncbi:pentapeptide repeat-containing protein [Lonepinella sp. BR2919]|uniref:pentapeptide repeat-containing protein n=1 Tax=unclassified Lonepinella TaxID=2642006 RepID=UPI003F6DC2EF